MAIKAKFTVDTTELNNGLKKAEKQTNETLEKIADGTETVSGGVSGILSLLGKIGPIGKIAAVSIGLISAGIVGAVKLINSLATKMDGISKSASAINVTTKSYQELTYAAKMTGLSIEDISMMINNLTYRLNQAASGTKNVVKAFAELGISWSQLAKLSPDRQLSALASILKNVPKDVRGRVLPQLFEKEDLNKLNRLINKDFGRHTATAEMLGLIIPEDAIENGEQFVNSKNLLSDQTIAAVAKYEASQKAMDTLQKLMKSVSKNYLKGGRLDPNSSYYEDFIGISDAQDELFEKIQANLNSPNGEVREQAEKLWAEFERNLEDTSKELLTYARMRYPDYNTNPKLRDEIDAQVQREALSDAKLKLLASVDPRFKMDDPTTWVQPRGSMYQKITDPKTIQQDLINAEITSFTMGLEAKVDAISKALVDLNSLDIEGKVAEIEKQQGLELSTEQKNLMKSSYLTYQHAVLKKINAENSKLLAEKERELQISKAILDNDSERVTKLQIMAKYNDSGIQLSLEDFDSQLPSEEELSERLKVVDKEIEKVEEWKKKHDELIEAYQEQLKKYKNLRKFYELPDDESIQIEETQKELDKLNAIKNELAEFNADRHFMYKSGDALLKEKAEIQQSLSILQARGELQKTLELNEQMGQLRLADYSKNYVMDIQGQLLKMAGYEREIYKLEVLRNAEKVKGLQLTMEEAGYLASLADLQYSLSNFSRFGFSSSGTLTNELASRGGFASSVVTDNAYNINFYLNNIQSLLSNISSNILKVGVLE